MTTIKIKFIAILFIALVFFQCSSFKRSKNKPYEYGWFPKTYQEVIDNYEKHLNLLGCKKGETIASIGAGNGRVEVEVSCLVENIQWYLQEIDSSRLYQFEKVMGYHENLKGSVINGDFKLILGTTKTTNLPKETFDRIIMVNVFHEMEVRKQIMLEIHQLLKTNGELVIMERMAKKPGEIHGDCKHPKLYESEFLNEMDSYRFNLNRKETGEKISNLIYYTFGTD